MKTFKAVVMKANAYGLNVGPDADAYNIHWCELPQPNPANGKPDTIPVPNCVTLSRVRTNLASSNLWRKTTVAFEKRPLLWMGVHMRSICKIESLTSFKYCFEAKRPASYLRTKR